MIGSTSTAFHVVATGDFDGNGSNDILFRNDNGQVVDVAAQQPRASCSARRRRSATRRSNFHVEGTGDLNGDDRERHHLPRTPTASSSNG